MPKSNESDNMKLKCTWNSEHGYTHKWVPANSLSGRLTICKQDGVVALKWVWFLHLSSHKLPFPSFPACVSNWSSGGWEKQELPCTINSKAKNSEGDRVGKAGSYPNLIISIASNQTNFCSILRVLSKYMASLKPNLKAKKQNKSQQQKWSHNRDGPW